MHMNFKTTLVLALVLIVGIVAVVLLDKKDEQRAEQKELDEKLLNIEKENVSEIMLEPAGIHAVRDSNDWILTDPVDARADNDAINSLLGIFDYSKQIRVISSDPSEYPVYGLQNPKAEMVLVHDGQSDTLYLGDDNPTGSYVFARQSGSPDVFLTSTAFKTQATKTLFDLRNKNVVPFDRMALNHLTIRNENGRFVFEKQAGAWELVEPIAYPVDETEMDEIINNLYKGKAKEFVAESPDDLSQFGLENPDYTAELLLGDEKAQKRLLIGKSLGDQRYAKDSSRDPVFVVDKAFMDKFQFDLTAVRKKEITDATSSQIRRFVLEHSGMTIEAELDSVANWNVLQPEKRPAKSWEAKSITAAIDRLKVQEFADDNPASLATYGLANPQVKAQFFDREKLLLELHIGNIKDDLVYAKKADQNNVFLIDDNILDTLTPDLEKLAESPEADTTAAPAMLQ
ncbi:DUF4340 domain-containing protein [candidate division KSB1 bacterium]|nr:DUF4340 domain-containing protein [candidate division KSB1 bacterium]